ncbi:MAG: hypothetical protein IPM97_03160 [Bdellovibrionaceae bacterium]|nr:hypothetical protein [Pseudobdellovibrionaceae bacterium]
MSWLAILSLVSVTSDPAGLVAGDEGKMWYRSDLNTIMYWDGAAAIPLGVAGAGMQSMNGLVATAQSFVVGTAGTNIAISSVGSTHTLDIPTASAANRGALSAADWSLFNNKMGTSLNSAQIWVGNSGNAATAVTMSGDATLDNTGALAIGAGKITAPMLSTGGINAATSGVIIAGPAGNLVNFACSTSGHVLKWSVTGWSCAYPDPSLPTLANGKIWVGNSGNAATEVTMSGDVSIDTAGVASLSTTGVTAGTYSKVTVDAKGRVSAGANLISSDIISMLGYTPVNKAGDVMAGNLSLSSVTSDPAGLVAGDEGKMWYRSDLNVVKYWDGSAAISLGVAGAGITNINGLTAGTQSFVTGSAGTDFNISSAGSDHTFNIPTASATNRGALSSADWTTFNAKQSSTLADAKVWVGNSGNAATAVSISGDASVANTGVLTLATSGVTAGTYPKVTVDAKGRVTSGANLANSDLPALPDGSMWVGNSGNTAAAVSMTGDASITNAGVLSLATSGVSAGTYSKVTVDAKGA